MLVARKVSPSSKLLCLSLLVPVSSCCREAALKESLEFGSACCHWNSGLLLKASFGQMNSYDFV